MAASKKAYVPGRTALGEVHGQVRIAQQGLGVRAVLRVYRDADARRDHQRIHRELHRLAQRADQPLGHGAGVRGAAQVRQQHHELIAAEAGDIPGPRAIGGARRGGLAAVAQRAAQAVGDHAQQLVADRVAERVVDALEVVEIEIQHRQHALVVLGGLEGAHQTVARLLAIRQAGERIEVGQAHDAPLGAPLAAQARWSSGGFRADGTASAGTTACPRAAPGRRSRRDRRPSRPCR